MSPEHDVRHDSTINDLVHTVGVMLGVLEDMRRGGLLDQENIRVDGEDELLEALEQAELKLSAAVSRFCEEQHQASEAMRHAQESDALRHSQDPVT